MKKTMLLAGTVLLFAASLLFLPGCRNAVQQPPETGEPGMGLVTLSLGHDGRARTIMPDPTDVTSVSDFYAFRVVFTAGTDTVSATWLYTELTANYNTIAVPPGTWSLVVTGYLDTADLSAAVPADAEPTARYASATTFTVAPGANTRTATLAPIVTSGFGSGMGTFSWDIDTLPGATGTIAIPTAVPAITPVVLGAANMDSSVLVNVGANHRVILTLNNGAGGTAVISSSLQIFQNMESLWEPTVTDFIMNLNETILRSWDGTVWAFDVDITPLHFAAMTPPIQGLADFDMAEIVSTFTALSYYATSPVDPDVDPAYPFARFQALADATRIVLFNDVTPADPGPGYVQGPLNAGGFATAAAARTAIAGIALNGTTIDAGDTGDITLATTAPYTATVVVGTYYTAVRVFTGPIVVTDVTFTVTIAIAGFDFQDVAAGTITPPATISYLALRGGPGGTPAPANVTVTGATSWSINGGDQNTIAAGAFTVTYADVSIGSNSITLYITAGTPARNYSVTVPLVVLP